MWKIQLFKLDFGDAEKDAVRRVLESGWLTMGEENQKFEEEFGDYHKSKYCLSVSSCTAALHLALVAVGIRPAEEVIVPSLTFVATANAVRYVGAIPVFADVIGAERPVLDPLAVEKSITPQTRAIIVVHYAGYPCDMDAFRSLADRYNLKLIEDCAHCPGARWNGRYLGTWGDVGCFSFFSNKNLSVGEGGAILTQSEEVYEKIKLLRSHGMTSLTLDRYKGHSFSYDVVETGYNYRFDEIRAALALVQLHRLEEMNKKRRRLMSLYRTALKDADVDLPFLDYEKAEGVDHIMPVFLHQGIDRQKVMEYMKEEGIQTSIHYPAIHRFSNFKGSRCGDLSVTEALSDRVVTLPLYPQMTEDDVDLVVRTFKQAVAC